MKTAQFSILILLSLGTFALSSNTYAQDYTRWDLPEGAKARLGKGWMTGKIAYFPNGRHLAVTSSIGTWIYDTDTGTVSDLLIGVLSVALSLDGTMIASIEESSDGKDSMVKIWDVATRQLKATLTGHTDHIYSVAFSPDGTTLASGGHDGMLRLWDITTGLPIATLVGHKDTIGSVVFQSR